jgi:hypothetical protein
MQTKQKQLKVFKHITDWNSNVRSIIVRLML